MTLLSAPLPTADTPADHGPIHQLSLSGGGFRAAFYHLGALHALATQGRLRDLKLLVTISGGSIAAAFFLQEWLAVLRNGEVSDDELAQCALRAQQALFRKSRHNPRLRVMASMRALSSGLVRNEFGFSAAMARINRRWLRGPVLPGPTTRLLSIPIAIGCVSPNPCVGEWQPAHVLSSFRPRTGSNHSSRPTTRKAGSGCWRCCRGCCRSSGPARRRWTCPTRSSRPCWTS